MLDERSLVESRNDENRAVLGQVGLGDLEQVLDRVEPDRLQVSQDGGLRTTWKSFLPILWLLRPFQPGSTTRHPLFSFHIKNEMHMIKDNLQVKKKSNTKRD